MTIGAGAAPGGIAPGGYGVPDAATSPINAPLPLPQNGLPQSGRAIDPTTRDYIMGSDGRLQGVDTVTQLVQLAITTTLGSSAMPTLGQSFAQVKEIGPGFIQQVTAKVASALAPLVNQGLVELVNVQVTQSQQNRDAGIVQFAWRDLTTNIQYLTPIGS